MRWAISASPGERGDCCTHRAISHNSTRSGSTPLQQQCDGVLEALNRMQLGRPVPIPQAQPIRLVGRLGVTPHQLEDHIGAVRAAGRSDPRGVASRLEGLAQPQ